MAAERSPIALALHGGSGTILREQLTPDLEAAYHSALESARTVGWKVLEAGGTALDAVEATVVSLEDCPLFNAGRGSVFTAEGGHEMDAAVMTGHDLEAGAVASLRGFRNPVRVARSVHASPDFVLLSGTGAEAFARDAACVEVEPEWFYVQKRYEEWQAALGAGKMVMDHDATSKFGTVGAVACDQDGNLAAATSTGGLTGKRYQRIGDSPLIGAGTYAENATCAVSCTGYGEFFIRKVTAHEVAARIRHGKQPLAEAAQGVVGELATFGGQGGLIAVNAHGEVSLPFNTTGMYRAWQTPTEAGVAIFA